MNVGSINSRRINAGVINGIPANDANVLFTEQPDTLTATTTLPIHGSDTFTEAADTLSATAQLQINGSLNLWEVEDSITSASHLAIQGSVVFTEAPDTVAIIAEFPRRDVLPSLRTVREDRATRKVVIRNERRAVAMPPQLRRTVVDPTGVQQPETNFALPHLGSAGRSLASLGGYSLNGLQINATRAA